MRPTCNADAGILITRMRVKEPLKEPQQELEVMLSNQHASNMHMQCKREHTNMHVHMHPTCNVDATSTLTSMYLQEPLTVQQQELEVMLVELPTCIQHAM